MRVFGFLILLFSCLFTFLFVNGCGFSCLGGKISYSPFATSLPSHIKTIAIPIFENTATNYNLEKNLQETLTNLVINKFLSSGQLRVVDVGKSDAILHATITDYRKTPERYSSSEQITAYRITITVHLVFEDVKNNKILWEDNKTVWGIYDVDPSKDREGETDAVYNTTDPNGPRLIEKLAVDIINRTISEEW